ncbi:MAG: D-alanyl-D-alanine carboxypeptidase family protein [Porcipelethomonas sp.]
MNEGKNASGRGLVLILVVLSAVFIIFFIVKFHDESPLDEKAVMGGDSSVSDELSASAAETEEPTQEPTEPLPMPEFSDYELYSSNVYLIDSEGELLYEKNGDERIYPASLTKIMTALVALDNIDDLDETIQIPGYIYDYINSENASTAGFEAYDTVTFRDLLYGAVLESGAECCLTLTDYISGTEYDFAELMNEKADELGMTGTHFSNSTGLHAYDHYSTVRDIAVLLEYAMNNYQFRQIFTSSSYYTETEYYPYGVTLNSTVFSMADSSYDGFELLGGKTGYTDEAGLCLASAAEIDGKEYLLVTAGAEGSHYTEPYHIEDAETVYSRMAEILGTVCRDSDSGDDEDLSECSWDSGETDYDEDGYYEEDY